MTGKKLELYWKRETTPYSNNYVKYVLSGRRLLRQIPKIGSVILDAYKDWSYEKTNTLGERINFALDYIKTERKQVKDDEIIRTTFKGLPDFKDERETAPIQWGCGRTEKPHKMRRHFKRNRHPRKFRFRKSTTFNKQGSKHNEYLAIKKKSQRTKTN